MSNNAVSLQGFYGGDVTHATAAWTSTNTSLTPERHARVPALLAMLAANEHGTPFERSLLHFHATVDTATHIHLLKHRHFSINGESARYKEYTEDKAYVPDDWDVNAKNELKRQTKEAYETYHNLLESKVSLTERKRLKESARYFLPYAIQVNLDFSCNFRAFVHFQKLRNSEHAQLEIRHIAQKMLELVKTETGGAFEHSLAAFGM
jgi:flavin-dependent thymidylate synthase